MRPSSGDTAVVHPAGRADQGWICVLLGGGGGASLFMLVCCLLWEGTKCSFSATDKKIMSRVEREGRADHKCCSMGNKKSNNKIMEMTMIDYTIFILKYLTVKSFYAIPFTFASPPARHPANIGFLARASFLPRSRELKYSFGHLFRMWTLIIRDPLLLVWQGWRD